MPPTFDEVDPAAMREAVDRQVDEKTSAPAAKAARGDDPRLKREYTFEFRYVAQDGTVHEGRFKNRILTVGERMRAGTLSSDLVGGRSYASLPGEAQQFATAVGWMTFSLDPKVRPDWAANLARIDDENLLLALFGEVWAHQNTFLGRADQAESQTGAT